MLSLYEQLLATRFEIVDGVGSTDGQRTLSRGELECVLAHLDSAINATRDMVSFTVHAPTARAHVFNIRRAYGDYARR